MNRSDRVGGVSAPTDAQLLSRVGAGDAQSLEALYDRYCGVVHGLATRLLDRPEEAEEVTQDVFWRLWKQPDAYDEARGTLRTWLVVVTRSRCLDRLRATQRRTPTDTEVETLLSTNETPETDASIAQRRRRVKDALRELPLEQRDAVLLCFYRGLSHREVAEHLGAPLGTVKSRIRIGMDKLKRSLAALGGAS